jgi:regulator of nonsense transcripts 1
MMTGGEGETADIGWIRKNLGFVADSHRICVGITRSKFGLVIVGNENVLKYDRIWKKLIEHYRKRGCFVQGDKFPR